MASSPALTRDTSLSRLFSPRKVAVVGLSADEKKVANRGARYMRKHGFAGEIIGVNPSANGMGFVRSIDDLPEGVDVAVLSVPVHEIVPSVAACGRKRVPFAVIFANGFADAGNHELQRELADVAKAGGIRLLGPNCLGLWDFQSKFAGTFSSLLDKGHVAKGSVGVVSQSGAVGNCLLLTYQALGVGISGWIATGNEVDIEALECVDDVIHRPDTELVAALLEAVNDGGSRIESLGRASRALEKPILVLKTGKSDVSRRAAESHTGKIVGSYEAWRQVSEQAGLLLVDSLEHLADATLAFVQCRMRRTGDMAIYCGSGGVGGLLSDELATAGLRLARLSDATMRELEDVLPAGASVGNPIDPTTVSEDVYYRAAEIILADPAVTTLVLVTNSLARDYDALPERLRSLSKIARRLGKVIALTYFSAHDRLAADIEVALLAEGMLVLPTGARLAKALGSVRQWEVFGQGVLDVATPHASGRLHDQRAQSLIELLPVLNEYGISVVENRRLHDVEDAMSFMGQHHRAIVLKLEAPGVSHKTELGMVRANLRTREEVASAFSQLQELQEAHHGEIVAQVHIMGAVEVIVGGTRDSELGPLVTVGLGGIFVELVAELSVAVCPISIEQADKLVRRGRLGQMLEGYRGQSPRDITALAQIVSAASRLVVDKGYREFEINPVLVCADHAGAWAVDGLAL